MCVVDATNLSRNLFLASQIAEREMPMVSTSGAGILIAQYLGARRRDLAAEYSLASLNMVTLSGIVIGIVFFISPDLYLHFYELEQSVHVYAL